MISKIKWKEDGTCTFLKLEGEYQDWIGKYLDELDPYRRKRVLDLIQKFGLHGFSENTAQRYVRAIQTFSVDGKPHEGLERGDLIEWIREGPNCRRNRNVKLNESKVNLTKRFCKRFLRYCHAGEFHLRYVEDYPEVLECFQYEQPGQGLPKNIPTRSGVKEIVDPTFSLADVSKLKSFGQLQRMKGAYKKETIGGDTLENKRH